MLIVITMIHVRIGNWTILIINKNNFKKNFKQFLDNLQGYHNNFNKNVKYIMDFIIKYFSLDINVNKIGRNNY